MLARLFLLAVLVSLPAIAHAQGAEDKAMLTAQDQAQIDAYRAELIAKRQREVAALNASAKPIAPSSASDVVAVATPPSPTTVNIQNVANAVLAFAAIVIPGLIGLIGREVIKRLGAANYAQEIANGIQKDKAESDRLAMEASLNQALTNVAQRAAGIVVDNVKSGAIPSEIKINSPQIAGWANYIMSHYPEFTAKLGLTPDKAAQMVLGETARIMHLSPTVVVPDATGVQVTSVVPLQPQAAKEDPAPTPTPIVPPAFTPPTQGASA